MDRSSSPTGISPGTIGLTTISGEVGRLIRLGQWLNNEGFERWEHAFVLLPGGNVLEAEPGGARIVPLVYTDVYWCNNIRKLLPVEPGTAPDLLNEVAKPFRGVGYSALDYFALALHHFHVNPPGLKAFIENDHRLICSQLADEFYLRLGAHIFDDGRWAGFVTPASLFRRDLELM